MQRGASLVAKLLSSRCAGPRRWHLLSPRIVLTATRIADLLEHRQVCWAQSHHDSIRETFDISQHPNMCCQICVTLQNRLSGAAALHLERRGSIRGLIERVESTAARLEVLAAPQAMRAMSHALVLLLRKAEAVPSRQQAAAAAGIWDPAAKLIRQVCRQWMEQPVM